MPEQSRWMDAATMPNPLDRDVWAETQEGQVRFIPKARHWTGTYRRWTPVLYEDPPTPPPYEPPLPAIAPCKRCGKPGVVGERMVRCESGIGCWMGPNCATPSEAIWAWNAIMDAPEEPKPVITPAGRTRYITTLEGRTGLFQLYTDGAWRPVK